MSAPTPSPAVPPPPEGSASWLDFLFCLLRFDSSYQGKVAAHASADLAALRKELSDTKAQLAMQANNTVEAMQQRDEARAELAKATTRQLFIDRREAREDRALFLSWLNDVAVASGMDEAERARWPVGPFLIARVQRLFAEAKERDELRVYSERLAAGIAAVRDLIDESKGVTGLHRNGDDAPWGDLLRWGWLEGWLLAFSDAETAIAERELRAAASPAGPEGRQ